MSTGDLVLLQSFLASLVSHQGSYPFLTLSSLSHPPFVFYGLSLSSLAFIRRLLQSFVPVTLNQYLRKLHRTRFSLFLIIGFLLPSKLPCRGLGDLLCRPLYELWLMRSLVRYIHVIGYVLQVRFACFLDVCGVLFPLVFDLPFLFPSWVLVIPLDQPVCFTVTFFSHFYFLYSLCSLSASPYSLSFLLQRFIILLFFLLLSLFF